ncbi:MAG: GntR family transcriptional regulator [Oscillospiraceae bacterium]|nr:GntR family transcriptional regulator [Oscillospiraceae bacterium]
MTILIDNKCGTPIYEQIFTQIKEQIMSGILRADSPLPSIRNLAKDLQISVITTKRAYDELEKEGYLYTLPGKGCFVAAKNLSLMREENLKRIEEHMEEILRLASLCGLEKEEVEEMWTLIREGSE